MTTKIVSFHGTMHNTKRPDRTAGDPSKIATKFFSISHTENQKKKKY